MACAIDECRKIFLELSLFWKLTLSGFLVLLGMGCTAFVWAHAIYRDDIREMDRRIAPIEQAFKDVAFVRTQSDSILSNQKVIIAYFARQAGRGK